MSPSSYTYGIGGLQLPCGLKPTCQVQDNCAGESNREDDAFEGSLLFLFQNPKLPLVLGEVRLVSRNLTEVPPEVSSLRGLHTLDLSNNHLTTLPSTLLSAPTLRELNLKSNNLSLQPVPLWFQHLSCCSKLNLQENPLGGQFHIVPGRALQRLKVLNLGDCSLSTLPLCFLSLRDLHTLHLSNREDRETAKQKKNQWRATQAHYRGCENLLTLPPLDALAGLVRLEVVGCSLSHLPSLASLPSLKLLVASSNKLTTLPDFPTALTVLSVEANDLLLLPSFAHLTKLAHIIASHNAISDISCLPESLETLDLYDNQLDQVDNHLTDLPLLVRVDVEKNYLPSVVVKSLGPRYQKLLDNLRDWSGEVSVGGTKCLVGVGSRLGRELVKGSLASTWRRRREQQTRRKAKTGDPEDDPTVELYAAHWRQKEICKSVEDIVNLEWEVEVLSTAEPEDQIQKNEDSGEDWGDEVEAYSRRGGLGVRYSSFEKL